jgi:DNA (cytosine-5)-methyltransferase 1
MTTIINTKLGTNKSGRKRLWLEGGKLLRENVTPGAKFNLDYREKKLIIRICENGKYTVSRRERAGKTVPIIDLIQQDIADLFEGVDALRVCVRNGLIVVSAHQQAERVSKRVQTLKQKILSGDSLSICSLFHGGGVLDKAMHHGLASAGIQSHVEVVVEIESAYLESSLANNPELWCTDSIVIESAIEQVSLKAGTDTQVDLVFAGIPCTGASRAGKSKNKLEFAESHQSAGAMFFYTLTLIQALNPAVVVLENVPEYQGTASMQVIRAVLDNLGYDIQERILDGNEFGALERRKRLCVVATCKGLQSHVDLLTATPLRTKEATLNQVLEPIPDDAACWRSFEYLAEKEARDLDAGKGFSRQLLTGDESFCGTIGRHYAKCRSTEPFIVHPENKMLSRLLTPVEHARVKAIPLEVIDGLSDTIAHQVLGQSVIYPAFMAVGHAVGKGITQWAQGKSCPALHDAA